MKPSLVNRREFLTKGGSTLAGLGLAAALPLEGLAAGSAPTPQGDASGTIAEYSLPPLSYDYDALEPCIDAETMRLHHDIHFAGYTRGLNQALEQLAEARESDNYSAVAHWQNQLAFNGAGYVLHTVFFQTMSPAGSTSPSNALKTTLAAHFGSFEGFKKHFSEASAIVQGSGWGLLGLQPLGRKLLVLQAEKHQNLTQWGIIPLLALDVWEHAYYLKYQNRRRDYISNWWEVVNWHQVEANLDAALEGPSPQS